MRGGGGAVDLLFVVEVGESEVTIIPVHGEPPEDHLILRHD